MAVVKPPMKPLRCMLGFHVWHHVSPPDTNGWDECWRCEATR